MRFPYRSYRVQLDANSPPALIYRPVVPVLLHGPHGVEAVNALLDSGADYTLFPIAVGEAAGVNIDYSRPGRVGGVGGSSISVYPATVELEFKASSESYRWPAVVRFGTQDSILLGHLGCLEFFIATFDGDLHTVELLPNQQFPKVT